MAASMGCGIMVAITPIMVLFLFELVGVRGVFFTIGIVGALLMLTATFLFFREEERPVPAQGVAKPKPAAGMELKEIMRSRQFGQLAIAMPLMASTVGPFAVHIQSMLTDSRLLPVIAATVAFFIGPSMVIGRLWTGALFDRFDTRAIAALAFFFPIVACILLLTLDGGYPHSVAAGIFVGLDMGAKWTRWPT
jgi:Na+/melibiose symporter-like transporter